MLMQAYNAVGFNTPGAASSAADSMCFAHTAALQGGDRRQKVKASRVFVQHLQHNVQKCPKTVSGRSTGPRGTQDRSRQVKTGQDRPQTGQDKAQDRPRQAQDTPKQTQDEPRQPQDRPRQAPRSDLDRIVVVRNHAKPQFFLWFPLMNTILLQKRPKSEKSANIVPTWPQHAEVLIRILEDVAPPKKGKAVC